MRRPDGNAPPGRSRGAARGALPVALLLSAFVSALVASATVEVPLVRAEPGGGAEGTVVYERPAPGPRRGVLSVPAQVVYGFGAFALLGGAVYLVARARRRR